MYGPLTRRNFNSDEAFNFFKLGGGNAQLKRNRYDVKEVVMRFQCRNQHKTRN